MLTFVIYRVLKTSFSFPYLVKTRSHHALPLEYLLKRASSTSHDANIPTSLTCDQPDTSCSHLEISYVTFESELNLGNPFRPNWGFALVFEPQDW